MERAVKGEEDVLWPGKPMYFCKTSGTTSGTKYIPITEDSLPNHLISARNALLGQIAGSGKADFVSGKMMFLQGSPELEETKGGIKLGRLSGIVAHHRFDFCPEIAFLQWKLIAYRIGKIRLKQLFRKPLTKI